MAKVVWALMCFKVIVDEKSRLTSLIDVAENINFHLEEYFEEGKDWMVLSGEYNIASYFIRSDLESPENPRIRFSIISPSGKTHGTKIEIDINLIEKDRARSFVKLTNIPFIESGMYCYKIEQQEGDEWIEISEIPIWIEQQKKS